MPFVFCLFHHYRFFSLIGMLSFLLVLDAHAKGVMELSGSFAYSKQVYGTDHDSKYTSRTYAGSYAWYIFSVTGIELNYSQTTDTMVNNDDEEIPDTGYSITQTRSEAITEVFGGGIRQALMPVKSLMVPSVSLGYARERKLSKTIYTIRNDTTGSTVALDSAKARTESNSAYGTFALKFNFSQTFSLNGSVTTVFRAFEWEEAKYNIKYFAGFSWYF